MFVASVYHLPKSPGYNTMPVISVSIQSEFLSPLPVSAQSSAMCHNSI